MCQPIAFKSGKDLGEETRTSAIATVTCVDCEAVETGENAHAEGWQMRPVVCPDCLRWTLTGRGVACTA